MFWRVVYLFFRYFILALSINILSKQVILFFWSGWFTAVIDFFCRGGWGVLLFLTYYIIFIQNLQCRSNHMIREPYDSTQAKIRANLESNLKILKRQSRITKSNLKTCMRSNRITNRILKSWRDRIETRIESYYYPDNESNLKFGYKCLNIMMFGVSWGDISLRAQRNVFVLNGVCFLPCFVLSYNLLRFLFSKLPRSIFTPYKIIKSWILRTLGRIVLDRIFDRIIKSKKIDSNH